jgi:Ca2+/Na+ antiporter
MKILNYLIALVLAFFGFAWLFNHVSAWGAMLFAGVLVYFVIFKILGVVKNEKD